MATQEELVEISHKINMDDIVREKDPNLRTLAKEVKLPLSDEDLLLGEKMLEFLYNSQDEVISEEMGLRGGVGLAAPQVAVPKRIIALLVPNNPETDEEGNQVPPKEPYSLAEVMYNAKIISESLQLAALAGGEGCLSVDREIPGYVIRKARVTVSYIDKNGEKQSIKLKGYNAIVVQHEIDHTNGVMFFDRINSDNPYGMVEGMQIIE